MVDIWVFRDAQWNVFSLEDYNDWFCINDSFGLFVAYGASIWSNSFHGELINLLDHWEHFTSHVSFS